PGMHRRSADSLRPPPRGGGPARTGGGGRGRPCGGELMTEFRMPSLGADMVEGTVLHWFVHPGQRVHRGDIVAEIDTTKAAIEVESFDDGVLTEILVPEGATVAVGTPLATIDTTAEPTSDTGPPARGDAEPAPADGF